VVVVVNFAGVPHEGYRLPLPTLPLEQPAAAEAASSLVEPSRSSAVPSQPLVEPAETRLPTAATSAGEPTVASVWREALNTDATVYGGSGVGNMGRVQAEPVPHHGRAWSAVVRVPPLGALILVPERPTAD
jgi:1,4-alpha-glucan branching enzyme